MVNFPEGKEDIHFKRKVLMLEKAENRAGSVSLGNFLHAEGKQQGESEPVRIWVGKVINYVCSTVYTPLNFLWVPPFSPPSGQHCGHYWKLISIVVSIS